MAFSGGRAREKSIPVIFSTGSLYPFGLDRSYAWVAEAGYDGVEIMMDERWDTHQAAYLNHLTDKHGIPILTLHTPLYRGAWGLLDPGETLVRSAGLADKVGARVVVTHPPPPGRPLARWAAGPLKRARARGVSVAVENMPRSRTKPIFGIGRNRVCYKPEHLLGLGDVTLDTSHVGASRLDLMEAYSKLAGQLCHVHLSDSDLSGGDQHRLPGKGKLPLKEFLAALKRDGYPGAVSLELKPWPLGAPDPEVIMDRMQGALQFTREGLKS